VTPTLTNGLHSVGATPSPLFYLKTEAAPVSETLFLKKKQWTMDKVLKQDLRNVKLYMRVRHFLKGTNNVREPAVTKISELLLTKL
jgi:hypothetical protein